MRIIDLLEGKKFNDLDFIQKEGDIEDINYDLAEDLIYFMNNDDDVYRRHVFPSIMNCVDRIDLKQTHSPSLFTNSVKESYKEYVKKFPIRHLPVDLDNKVCEEICDKLHEEVCKDHTDGKYKD